ncbi:hypothetical protein BDN67DRAFT_1047119 [Paxillus ammoniavirescens]|nr:hypothetical protein BDN67DRAFT_1047119 [Paxillus ammoniavirescens]
MGIPVAHIGPNRDDALEVVYGIPRPCHVRLGAQAREDTKAGNVDLQVEQDQPVDGLKEGKVGNWGQANKYDEGEAVTRTGTEHAHALQIAIHPWELVAEEQGGAEGCSGGQWVHVSHCHVAQRSHDDGLGDQRPTLVPKACETVAEGPSERPRRRSTANWDRWWW